MKKLAIKVFFKFSVVIALWYWLLYTFVISKSQSFHTVDKGKVSPVKISSYAGIGQLFCFHSRVSNIKSRVEYRLQLWQSIVSGGRNASGGKLDLVRRRDEAPGGATANNLWCQHAPKADIGPSFLPKDWPFAGQGGQYWFGHIQSQQENWELAPVLAPLADKQGQ